MLPPVPVSVPLNATLPTLVAPRPVEQERDRSSRPLTAQAITSSDESTEYQAFDERSAAIESAARRETARRKGERGAEIDLLV